MADIDLVSLVTSKVKDDSGKISTSDLDSQISEALTRYSCSRPNRSTVDVIGNGTHDYSLPAGWIEGFSEIRDIEYPIGQIPALLLDDDDYAIYESPTGKKLRLLGDAPHASESFRITFSVPHIAPDTVPQNDLAALACLAASLCLEMLANAWIQSSDSTIAADSVNYRSKSQEAASRAKQMMKLYKEHLGLKEEDTVPAASAISSQEVDYPGGGDRLTHPKRDRRLR